MIYLYSHPSAGLHEPGPGHPEAPARMQAIETALTAAEGNLFERFEAPPAHNTQIERIHPKNFCQDIANTAPRQGYARIDGDTVMNPHSLEAALRASGGVCAGVDAVLANQTKRAFCLMRPPGHHAEPSRAMGFCLFNQIAVGAVHARHHHGVGKIAIIDFDVHHGNGTQAAFWGDCQTLYLSSHQLPLFPGTGHESERGDHDNICNLNFAAGTAGAAWRARMEREALPKIDAFAPELLLISAGFDAHELDPLASMRLLEDDFAWITSRLVELAERHGGGRVVGCLEGGYHPPALATSLLAHLNALNAPV